MSNVVYFPNLKNAGSRPIGTGTVVADASLVNHSCLDVFARNASTDPLYVSGVSGTVRETRFHDAATTGINAHAGAFVEVDVYGTGTGAVTATAITRIRVNCTLGEPLQFRLGANAGAAAAASDLFIVNRGEAWEYNVAIAAGQRLWVRSLGSAVSSGEITINLIG